MGEDKKWSIRNVGFVVVTQNEQLENNQPSNYGIGQYMK